MRVHFYPLPIAVEQLQAFRRKSTILCEIIMPFFHFYFTLPKCSFIMQLHYIIKKYKIQPIYIKLIKPKVNDNNTYVISYVHLKHFIILTGRNKISFSMLTVNFYRVYFLISKSIMYLPSIIHAIGVIVLCDSPSV